jgi:small subunit ribosomal protein S4
MVRHINDRPLGNPPPPANAELAVDAVLKEYELSESKLKSYARDASLSAAPTEELRFRLETSLDSVVYHLGFALDRKDARKLVEHGHIFVNEQRLDDRYYKVKQGDVVSFDPAIMDTAHKNELAHQYRGIPGWLRKRDGIGEIVRLPKAGELDAYLDLEKVIEHFLEV